MRLVAVLIALACHTAYADPEQREPPQPVESYRGSMLAGDGIAVATLAVAAAGGSGTLAVVGVSTYIALAPVMHVSKERYGRALASVSMRIGFPLLGAVVGDSIPRDCGHTGDCIDFPRPAVFIGVGVGALAACAVDTIFLAKGDTPPAQAAQAGWTPVAMSTRGGLALGIAGQF